MCNVLVQQRQGMQGTRDFTLAAEDADLAQAKERLTLKHCNSGRWACDAHACFTHIHRHACHNCVQATKAGEAGDEEFIRLAAEDAELARAKERLTLKHRNSSRWARRALKRGMDVMDEGTKAAVAEQLRLGEELRRKVSAPCKTKLSKSAVTCMSVVYRGSSTSRHLCRHQDMLHCFQPSEI